VNPYQDNHLEPGDPPLVVQLFGPQLFGQQKSGANPGAPQPVGGR
jgi:hypothetical protein